MNKNRIQRIIPHTVPCDLTFLRNHLDSFHVEIIRRKLNQSALTAVQKIIVLDTVYDYAAQELKMIKQ